MPQSPILIIKAPALGEPHAQRKHTPQTPRLRTLENTPNLQTIDPRGYKHLELSTFDPKYCMFLRFSLLT